MRTDIWQAAIVCSGVIWFIGYILVIAKLVDKPPQNQVNVLSVEGATQEKGVLEKRTEEILLENRQRNRQ